MKKKFAVLTALTLSFSMVLSGCSLGKDDSKEATEYINDENVDASDDASQEISSNIIVADSLEEPDYNDPTAGASVEVAETPQEENPVDDNLVMVFFGDSQMANGRGDGTDIPTLVGQRVPNATVYNLGIGGTTAAFKRTSAGYLDYENWTDNCFLGMTYCLSGQVDRNKVLAESFPDVLNTMNQIDPSQVDYYFIEYGFNDFMMKTPLDINDSEGHPTDLPQEYTFYGSLSYGINVLKKISPQAKIVMMYPFYGIYKDGNGAYLGDSFIVSNGVGTLSDYADKMGNVAEDQGTFIFDGMYHTKCDLYVDTQEQYLQDTVHLTETGRRIMARLIAHIPNGVEGYEPTAYRDGDFIKIAEFNPDETYRMDPATLKEHFSDQYDKYINGDYILAQPQ
ncbi:SGNH/GDSL hydrolase family protein [Butyrivibrio sp. XBB1001]|uniref:SGNH/GDSL hydrolase family protein n=1 Tax=Butyrivibrio sp. XBB1001 TaxID=1280682 RepID=UPI0003FB3EE2|nr:SGNH/GDSL hydrolase family protein [Butyrivibrio sp. XBB1001]